jgi:hypothetical protein
MVQSVRPGGQILDLQVIRPNPRIEVERRFICEVDGEPLFIKADAAVSAIDELIRAGQLVEEAVDDHDSLVHFENGSKLVTHFEPKKRRLPEQEIPGLLKIHQPVVMRERCRLRRLAVR